MDMEFEHIQGSAFKVRDLVLYLIYRSPNARPESIPELCDLVKRAGKNSVLFGDFNLPGIDWSGGTATGRAAEFMEAADDALMDQLVEFATQVSGNTLDLVITNAPERITEVSEEGRLGSSDHTMIKVKINQAWQQETVKEIRNWRRADWKAMRTDMAKIRWKTELQGSTEDMWRLFKGKVKAAIEKHVPTRKIKKGGKAPWISREILAEIKKKKRMWKQRKKGEISEEYRQQENKVKKMIRKAKRKHEKELATDGDRNKRKFFAYVKRKTQSRQSVGPLKNKAGATLTSNKEMADELNKFFSSVFSEETLENIPVAETMEGEPMMDVRFTEWKIRRKIRKLKKESAAGPDEIGPRILQELEEAAAAALNIIFRKSLRTGEVPNDWRRANVTPIFKKGAKTDPGNYRPVSLTAVCCKLMESIVRDELVKHLEQNSLLSESQHGFMQGRSCVTNLLEFFETITKELDGGVPMDVVYLDFAKAFDKVPKMRLMEKLRAHKVEGDVHRWIHNWLSDRRQRVVLNGEYSEWAPVKSGVPQGSVLGPTLFTVYINDLDAAAALVAILKKFADDTKVGNRAATEEDRRTLQQALDNLCAWAETWQMQFNVKKCKVLHLGNNNRQMEYYMNGQKLEKTSEEVDVGVTISKNCKPSAQCAKAARTAQAVLGQVARAFHYRDRHIFVRLYIQYVRPHLEYAAVAWSPWLEGDKECLEKVQRRAVAMVAGLTGRTYEERLEELGMVTLAERRHQLDMLQVYKILNSKDNVKEETWFERVSNTGRATRAADDPLNLRIPAPRLEIRRHFFSQRTPKDWNNVPAKVKNAPNTMSFKNGYKVYRRQRATGGGDE